jgi:fructose-bisphosphate aldolase, class II
MVSWGVRVNDYGNAVLDDNGDFIKLPDAGVSEAMWEQLKTYAQEKGWKGGDYKKLNRPFENKLLGQPREIRERMIRNVEDFVYNMIVNVFNSNDTAPLALEAILNANSYDMGPKASRIEDPAEWTEEKIRQKAKTISTDKGPQGDFSD